MNNFSPVEVDCMPLDIRKVADAISYSLRTGTYMLGRPPQFWRDHLLDAAQPIADEADPYEYSEWGVKFLEITK